MDVFCLPSHREGLGTSVLDAMAAGIPVVAARGGGIPEMVEDERSGILVPPGEPRRLAEAIERVLCVPSLRERLVAGGEERVRMFSADRMVEGTLRVYQDVLARGSSRSGWGAGGNIGRAGKENDAAC
jgi:glycosyltransferase involved in cell wall biosynthesis